MAGNKQVFDESLQQADSYANNNQWKEALAAYVRAAREFPNDVPTRTKIALALLKTGRFDDALKQYEGLSRAHPDDTELLTRIVEIYHRTGQTDKTVESLLRIKNVYSKHNQVAEALEALNDAAELAPDRPEIVQELLELAQQNGENALASQAALHLANYYQQNQQPERAVQLANQALELDSTNSEAHQFLAQFNQSADDDFNYLSEVELPSVGTGDLDNLAPLPSLTSDLTEPETLAVTDLDQLIASAENALEQGQSEAAIQQYEQALSMGAERSDIFYSLGRLYTQTANYDRAVEYLQRAAKDSDYAASAYFALGDAYEQAAKYADAIHYYEQALAGIDLENVNVSEAEELIDMYEVVAECYIKQNEDNKAAELYTRLSGVLQSKNIHNGRATIVAAKARELTERALQQRQKELASVTASDTGGSLADLRSNNLLGDAPDSSSGDDDFVNLLLDNKNGASANGHNVEGKTANGKESNLAQLLANTDKEIKNAPHQSAPLTPIYTAIFPIKLLQMEPLPHAMPYLRAAEDFMNRNLLMAATDACHELIRSFPDYLPAQAILAETYVTQNKLEQARVKYQYIIDLYQMRNEPLKAIEIYKRLTEISPDNTAMRTKLANLMLQYGQREAAAEILLATIQNFIKIGQIEQALEECKKLCNLAPNSVPVRLQYGELLDRVSRFQEAINEFRRAVELDPSSLKGLCWLNITLFLINEGEVKWNSFKSVLDRSKESPEVRATITGEYLQALFLFDHAGLSYALGCLHLEMQDTNATARDFEQTISLAGQVAEQNEYEVLARFQLGQLRLKAERYNDAIQEFSKVLNLLDNVDPTRYASVSFAYGALPSQIVIYRQLAQAFIAEDKIEYAVKALRTVKRLLPYDREVHFQLAELNFQRGQLNEALGELGELADHYEENNKLEETVEVLKEMVRLAPNNIPVRDKLSSIYMKRGYIDAGLQELDELSELQRKNGRLRDAVKTLQRAAETYWMMARQDKAYDLYDRIVRISPGDVEARQQLVNLHILAGRIKDAVEEQRTIAQICLQSRGPKEAIGALHQVISLAPDDTRAYFALAQVLSDTGEFGQAYRLYGRILKIAPDNVKAKNLQDQIKSKAMAAGQLSGNAT